jgi:hypothetical protein
VHPLGSVQKSKNVSIFFALIPQKSGILPELGPLPRVDQNLQNQRHGSRKRKALDNVV